MLIRVLFFFIFFISCEKSEVQNKSGKKAESDSSIAVLSVESSYSTSGRLQKTISSDGRAQAFRKAPVIFMKNAYLIKLSIREGQYVKKGAPMAALQNEQETIAVQENRASLIKSITEFAAKIPIDDSTLFYLKKRLLKNSNNKPSRLEVPQDIALDSLTRSILSGKNRIEVLLATSGLSQAYTAYQKALLNYKRTFFYAPFSGFVGDIVVKEGEYISAGQPVAVLYDLSKIKLTVDVLESEVPLIRTELSCSVEFFALPGKYLSGKIYEINPVIDLEKHTQRIGVLLNNGSQGIYPGMSALVKIAIAAEEETLLVPKEAVLERDGRFLVFVVRDSIANWCYITPGESNEKYMQILSSEFNLKPGEPVITKGHFTLAHGTKVRIKE